MLSMPTTLKKNLAPIVINKFLGMNVGVSPTELDLAESPDMLNMMLDENYQPQKRFGYKDTTPLDPTGQNYLPHNIVKIIKYKSSTKSCYLTLTYDLGTLYIYKSLFLKPSDSFELIFTTNNAYYANGYFQIQDKLYILTGGILLVYDGTNISIVQDNAYVPTLFRVTTPAGAGTAYEQWNLIGKGFKILFNGDGTSKTFTLCGIKDLDSTTVIAKVNGTTLTEGTDFTVDRVNGTVTFNTAPSASGTTNINNVEITAYKTYEDKLSLINNCNRCIMFGGANDSRVFMTNIESNVIYYNELNEKNDPTFFAENNTIIPNANYEHIMGFCKQYEYLTILGDTNIYSMSYDPNSNVAKFPIKTISHDVGCIASESIRLVDNRVTYLSATGVKQIVQTNIIDQRNIVDISADIYSKISQEGNQDYCKSTVYNNKYFLFFDHNIYIYDYMQKKKNTQGVWYIWKGINISNYFIDSDGKFYFHYSDGSGQGKIYCMKDSTDTDPYTDNGAAIDAYWISKEIDFGTLERMKRVKEIRISLQPSTFSSVLLYYYTDKNEASESILKRVDTLDFDNIDFDRFSFIASDKPQIIVIPIKEKKINYFQLKLENNSDEPLGILKIEIAYNFQGKNK